MPAPTATSYIDEVNEADEPVGRVQRGQVFERGARFRVAHVFVRNHRGEVLLQQVGHHRERSPLHWGSSVAAYLHVGESYADGARRRLREELGITAPVAKIGAVRMPDHGAAKFITVFEAQADDPVINDPEHIEAVEFRSIADIDRQLAEEPDRFTETFPYAYRVLRSTLAT